MNVLSRLRRFARPLLALAILAGLAFVFRGHAHAASALQGTPLDPADEAGLAKVLELLNTLARLAPLAALVIPLTEVRRVLGGLPNIPLPGGQEISAGRWVSWLVGGALLGLGYLLGYIPGPSAEVPFALWLGSRWAMIGILSNVIYDRWFAPTPDPQPIEGTPAVLGKSTARA